MPALSLTAEFCLKPKRLLQEGDAGIELCEPDVGKAQMIRCIGALQWGAEPAGEIIALLCQREPFMRLTAIAGVHAQRAKGRDHAELVRMRALQHEARLPAARSLREVVHQMVGGLAKSREGLRLEPVIAASTGSLQAACVRHMGGREIAADHGVAALERHQGFQSHVGTCWLHQLGKQHLRPIQRLQRFIAQTEQAVKHCAPGQHQRYAQIGFTAPH